MAVVVGMRGTHSVMKVGSVVFTMAMPASSALSAVSAALTAASAASPPGVPPPPGVPVPPPVGNPVDVVVLAGRAVVAAFVAALVVLLEDEDAYVLWSVSYCATAFLYVASAARTAFCRGVVSIEASACPAVTVSPALTLTAVIFPAVGKLTLDCDT
jgi:hypothetical protein